MKIAIITGASSGLGREFVRQVERFYNNLDEIWVMARREERLLELKKEMKNCIRVFAGDMKESSVYQRLEKCLKTYNPDVRMLVNAAGFGKVGTVEEIAKEDETLQLSMIDLNCRELTRMTSLCLPYCSKGSRIINIASAAAFCPQSGFAVYAATKSYVLSFSRGLNEELRKRQVYVTAVCPGPVATEFFQISGTASNMMKEYTMVKPELVVRQALLDSRRKKDMSVYSAAMKSARVAAKLLPHGFAIKAMSKLEEMRKK